MIQFYHLNSFFNLRSNYRMQKLEDSFEEYNSATKKTDKSSNKKNKIIINVAQTHYPIVKHVSKKYKWNLTSQPISFMNFDICWMDGHLRHQHFSKMQQHQKINRFPGMVILSRKNNLGHNLMLFKKKFPYQYDFFPITWNLPGDFSELQSYHDCRQQGKAQTFIVKPEASCQGRGIFLTRNIESLKHDKYVVQRYMHKPYLIDGLKFDLRIYVLVTGIDPLRIFVYEEGLARFATEPYKAPRSDNLDNRFMHLTNYAVNKDHPNFIFNESVNQMHIGHKRSLTSVYKYMEENGHDVEELKEKINDIFIKTIITGYPNLSSSYLSVHPDNFANNMCFQILGFDIMIDHKLTPYLIEVNYTPSFTTDTPLDRHIKKNLIQDTVKLINLSDEWKKEMKSKKQKEFQERMVSGKRKKYSNQQRKTFMAEESKKRNEYECQNLGGFDKIFVLSEDQMKQYTKYYDYAFDIFHGSSQKNFSTITPVTQYPFYKHYFDEKVLKKNVLPPGSFTKSQRHPLKQRKDPNNKHIETMNDEKSIDHKARNNSQVRKTTSAKNKKRNDKKENERNPKVSYKNIEPIQRIQKQPEVQKCLQNESIFQNKLLEEAINLKKRKSDILLGQTQQLIDN